MITASGSISSCFWIGIIKDTAYMIENRVWFLYFILPYSPHPQVEVSKERRSNTSYYLKTKGPVTRLYFYFLLFWINVHLFPIYRHNTPHFLHWFKNYFHNYKISCLIHLYFQWYLFMPAAHLINLLNIFNYQKWQNFFPVFLFSWTLTKIFCDLSFLDINIHRCDCITFMGEFGKKYMFVILRF